MPLPGQLDVGPGVSDISDDVAAATAFVSPRSMAIIGASERSRWASALADNLDRHGFAGKVHLVNPRGGVIGDRPVATSCSAIGEQVDLGVVIVPASASVEAVASLADAGVGSAMVLTSGFAETGPEGLRLQSELLAAAQGAGVRLVGPNSLGFMNLVEHAVAWATPIEVPAHTDGIALVSQSGATAFFLADLAYRQGIALSHVVATGNEADLDGATFAAALAANPHVTAIAMFLESVRNPDRFLAAAEAARSARKPLVVLKVGASEVTARSALAHTGALVGDDRVFDGLCQRYGIVRVGSLEELMTTADIIGRTGVLSRDGLLIVSNSGGVCEIAGDTAHRLGIDLPEVPDDVAPTIREAMPDFATPHNPLDLTGAVRPDEVDRIVTTLAGTEQYGAALVPFYSVAESAGWAGTRTADLQQGLARGLQDARRQSGTHGFVVTYTAHTLTPEAQQTVDDFGLPYLACGMDRALSGLAHAFRWSRYHRNSAAVSRPETGTRRVDVRPQSEFETMRLLADHGVPVVPQVLAADPAAAALAAAGWTEASVLKIASPDIAHKTEIGGVALAVLAADVESTAQRLIEIGRSQPGARVDGVLVSPMRRGGTELFVGCSFDPVWGPVLALGIGGIWVEVLADVAVRPLPIMPGEVVEMLKSLQTSALLTGARGRAPADLEAVARAVVLIGDFAVALGPDLAALDVNPLLVDGARVEALDALAVWA